MTQDELAAIIAGVTAQLKPQTPAPTTADAALPGWVGQAKASGKAKAKATATAAPSVKPHHIAGPASFKGSKGVPINGIRVVKMFGAEPDRRRPDGKFLTYGEVRALLKVAHLIPAEGAE